MFCKSCGKQLDEGARFCGNCGTPINRVPEEAAAPQDTLNQENAPEVQTTQEKVEALPTEGKPLDQGLPNMQEGKETAPEPVHSQSSDSEPVTSEPETSEPVTSEPVTSEPVTSEPVTSEPVTSEPVTSEPVTSEPVTTEPAQSEPIKSEPIQSEPVLQSPVINLEEIQIEIPKPAGKPELVFGELDEGIIAPDIPQILKNTDVTPEPERGTQGPAEAPKAEQTPPTDGVGSQSGAGGQGGASGQAGEKGQPYSQQRPPQYTVSGVGTGSQSTGAQRSFVEILKESNYLIPNIIAALVCCPMNVIAIVGLIFSAIGMSYKNQGREEEGKRMASVGMILFWVTAGLELIFCLSAFFGNVMF